MDDFVPYEKKSKREQRRENNRKRNTWGSLNPVTRKPKNSKAYDRNKEKIREFEE